MRVRNRIRQVKRRVEDFITGVNAAQSRWGVSVCRQQNPSPGQRVFISFTTDCSTAPLRPQDPPLRDRPPLGCSTWKFGLRTRYIHDAGGFIDMPSPMIGNSRTCGTLGARGRLRRVRGHWGWWTLSSISSDGNDKRNRRRCPGSDADIRSNSHGILPRWIGNPALDPCPVPKD